MLDKLVQSCLLIGSISLVVFLAISILLSNWAVKPVEQAWIQQKQFIADASHELKTPLTVILTNAELLQDQKYDSEEKQTFTSSILAMSHQMRGLVESLLELARVDNGTIRINFSKLDFSQLVSDAALPFEPLYFEKEQELRCSIEPDILLKGSQNHLRQVVDILLDNAMKYSQPGAVVNLDLKKQGNHCLLCVSNPGEPIDAGELKKLFKRFYRRDTARSMNHSYGLGLSIAETIVHEHSGKIWAEYHDGMIRFMVQLSI